MLRPNVKSYFDLYCVKPNYSTDDSYLSLVWKLEVFSNVTICQNYFLSYCWLKLRTTLDTFCQVLNAFLRDFFGTISDWTRSYPGPLVLPSSIFFWIEQNKFQLDGVLGNFMVPCFWRKGRLQMFPIAHCRSCIVTSSETGLFTMDWNLGVVRIFLSFFDTPQDPMLQYS